MRWVLFSAATRLRSSVALHVVLFHRRYTGSNVVGLRYRRKRFAVLARNGLPRGSRRGHARDHDACRFNVTRRGRLLLNRVSRWLVLGRSPLWCVSCRGLVWFVVAGFDFAGSF